MKKHIFVFHTREKAIQLWAWVNNDRIFSFFVNNHKLVIKSHNVSLTIRHSKLKREPWELIRWDFRYSDSDTKAIQPHWTAANGLRPTHQARQWNELLNLSVSLSLSLSLSLWMMRVIFTQWNTYKHTHKKIMFHVQCNLSSINSICDMLLSTTDENFETFSIIM